MQRTISRILVVAAICLAIPAASAEDGYRFLEMDGHDVKWGIPQLGSGATLTYAIAAGPTTSAGINNCRAITNVNKLLSHSGLTLNGFDTELTAALGMWEKAANVRFVPAKSPATADLLISAEAVADGVAYADVTPESSDGQKLDRITKGIVCLSPDQRWTTADSPPATGRSVDGRIYHLRYVLAHEIGHVLGLDHPSPTGELMSFEYTDSLNGLQPGDIAGIVALYGPLQKRTAAPVVALNSPNG